MAVMDFLPKHIKGYTWIAFLFGMFLLMAMSENGAFEHHYVAVEQATPFGKSAATESYAAHTKGEKHEKKPFVHGEEEKQEILGSPAKTSSATSSSHTSLTKTAESGSQKLEIAGTTKSKQSDSSSPMTFNGLDPKDVVVVVKTGASSIWRRMPIHLSTTLSNPLLTPNILYYSDSPDNLAGHPVVDSLANVSSTLKASSDFALYHKAKEVASNNLYLEDLSMEGDSYLPGGWRLDKYKFLPMFQHVAATMPGKKWYIYMEDDNYFFWASFYAWLSTFDASTPIVVGSPAYRLGEDFAHGGSGFAISGAAMKASFGSDKQLAARYEDYAQEQCCGDQVLAHVLRSKGVERVRTLDNSAWKPLQALPTWKMGFGDWNWCSPVMNVHKVHQADISRLFVFEQEFMAKSKGSGRMRYKDIYLGLAKPQMTLSTRIEWDNFASARTFSSSQEGREAVANLTAAELAQKPWISSEGCLKACIEWDQCLSWKYADDSCSLDHVAAMGQKIDGGIRMVSGWMLERIAALESKQCDALGL